MGQIYEFCNNTLYYTSIFSIGSLIIYKLCHYYHPIETNEKILTLGFKCIDYVNHSKKFIKQTSQIPMNLYQSYMNRNKITFIFNGNEIQNFSTIDDLVHKSKININNYDFVLYNFKNGYNDSDHFVRLNNINNLLELPTNYEDSNITFISIRILLKNSSNKMDNTAKESSILHYTSDNELEFNNNLIKDILSDEDVSDEDVSDEDISDEDISDEDETIKEINSDNNSNVKIIEINTDNLQSFFIAGNIILDKEFLEWYMKKYYGIIIDNDTDYHLDIMDTNFNHFNISSNEALAFEQDSYHILNNIKDDGSDDEKEDQPGYFSNITKYFR